MLKRTIMYKPVVIALTLLSAVNLVSSFPDSGKWVYKNISMTEQYIGKCSNTLIHLIYRMGYLFCSSFMGAQEY